MRSDAGSDKDLPPFQCSPGFIASFKKHHRLTSRKIHYKRRPTLTDDQRTGWLARIRTLIVTVERSRIINCDETSWLLHPKRILTSAERGCPAVPAKINGDEKECITIVAWVTAAGEKLPLAFIASGKKMIPINNRSMSSDPMRKRTEQARNNNNH
jgi:hypothetical protein